MCQSRWDQTSRVLVNGCIQTHFHANKQDVGGYQVELSWACRGLNEGLFRDKRSYAWLDHALATSRRENPIVGWRPTLGANCTFHLASLRFIRASFIH